MKSVQSFFLTISIHHVRSVHKLQVHHALDDVHDSEQLGHVWFPAVKKSPKGKAVVPLTSEDHLHIKPFITADLCERLQLGTSTTDLS